MALVFLDLDGTMLETGKPAKDIVDTIKQLKKNGHIPIIASGRTPSLLYGIDKLLGIDSFICANGNYINYQGKVVYERYIPKAITLEMADLCDKLGCDLVFQSAEEYVAHSKNTPLVHSFCDIYNILYPRVEPNYHRNHDILAMTFFDDHFVDLFRGKFPGLLFSPSNRFGFDVNLQGDLKAEGIRWLVKYLNYPEEDVYAIGDGLNDIAMLKAVAHGIAMGNGFPEVKAVASYITSAVNEEGVANALRHFHLI